MGANNARVLLLRLTSIQNVSGLRTTTVTVVLHKQMNARGDGLVRSQENGGYYKNVFT